MGKCSCLCLNERANTCQIREVSAVFQPVGSCTHLSSSSLAWGLVQCTVKMKCPREVASRCSGISKSQDKKESKEGFHNQFFVSVECSEVWGLFQLIACSVNGMCKVWLGSSLRLAYPVNGMCKVCLGGSPRLKFPLGGMLLNFLGIRKSANTTSFQNRLRIFPCVQWDKIAPLVCLLCIMRQRRKTAIVMESLRLEGFQLCWLSFCFQQPSRLNIWSVKSTSICCQVVGSTCVA